MFWFFHVEHCFHHKGRLRKNRNWVTPPSYHYLLLPCPRSGPTKSGLFFTLNITKELKKPTDFRSETRASLSDVLNMMMSLPCNTIIAGNTMWGHHCPAAGRSPVKVESASIDLNRGPATLSTRIFSSTISRPSVHPTCCCWLFPSFHYKQLNKLQGKNKVRKISFCAFHDQKGSSPITKMQKVQWLETGIHTYNTSAAFLFSYAMGPIAPPQISMNNCQ